MAHGQIRELQCKLIETVSLTPLGQALLAHADVLTFGLVARSGQFVQSFGS